MERVTLFMFLPATVIHNIHATANQQGTVWLTNSEGPSKMLIFFFFFAGYLNIGSGALALV